MGKLDRIILVCVCIVVTVTGVAWSITYFKLHSEEEKYYQSLNQNIQDESDCMKVAIKIKDYMASLYCKKSGGPERGCVLTEENMKALAKLQEDKYNQCLAVKTAE